MININIQDEQYSIKNKLNEMTIGEYEKVTEILNNEKLDYIDKWIEVLILLGLSEDVIDTFGISEFTQIIKGFQLAGDVEKEIQQTITLNDKPFNSFTENDFKITVKEMAMIENVIKKKPTRYLGDVLAILYKSPDADRTINYDKSHIKFKAELIRKEVTADVVVPILNKIGQIIIKDFNTIENE